MSNEEIKIGKDVIETLTLGMYEDSKFVFREYIQNSADAIDKAIREGLFKTRNEGHIEITINCENKQIKIEDNATGIPTDKFLNYLRNIADGVKDRNVDKGFRGIGRLGGLAYCKELRFESKFKGEENANILIWDAEKLKNIINDRIDKKNASQVIFEITEYKTERREKEEHYFKVILQDVSQSELLNLENIRNYLSLTAPVPFHAKFLFKEKIYSKVTTQGLNLDEYRIYVNNEQVYKAYKTRIYRIENGNKDIKQSYDEIHDIEFFDIKQNDRIIAWGWYGLSTFNGVIHPKLNPERGIRLRKGNIQLGDESTLLKLHREENRGNNYFIGEVHAIDPNLIPNARRDYFIENESCKYIELKIKEEFYKIYDIYQKASIARSNLKQIEKFNDTKFEYNEKKKVGFINKEEKMSFDERLKKEKSLAEQARKKIDNLQQNESEQIRKVVSYIFKNKDKSNDFKIPESEETPYITDNLSKLTKEERKFVSKIYAIIKKTCPPTCSEMLIEKIQESFIK